MVNNKLFTPGTGIVSFTGNTVSAISGTQPIQFYTMEINKTSGSLVLLQRIIGITQQVSFTEGFLKLNNYNADMGRTGILIAPCKILVIYITIRNSNITRLCN